MRILPFACLALALGGCLDAPTKTIELVANLSDAGPDAQTAPDGGGGPTPCERDEQCEGALFSRCGADGKCAPCEESAHCARVPDAKVCIAGSGCFACTSTDTKHCPAGEELCSDDNRCVQCTEANTGACAGTSRPLCEANLGKCVECRSPDDCQDPTLSACISNACAPCESNSDCTHLARANICEPESRKCVECQVDADCGADTPVCDTASGTCGACTDSTQCAHFDASKVCESGGCVECTAAENAACESAAGGPFVCNALTHVCSDRAPASADVCSPCVSDAQCKAGQACVSDGMSGDSWACQWIKGGGGAAPVACTATARPFVKNAQAASIDGQTVALCTLATSTCSAHRAFRSSCGRFGADDASLIVESRFDERIPGSPVDADEIKPDDSVCGVGGRCVANDADAGAYLCSVSCGNADADCPVGAFTCGGSPPGLPNVCSI